MIQVASPIIGNEEIDAIDAVLASGRLVQGPEVAELEKSFAKYSDTKYAVAVNSGTAALHAALFAAGVGPGDEVITTSFSFIATVNPILFLGAKPVLVDIDPVTYNLDVDLVEQAVTSKTKVIIPVHLYGQPYDHAELEAIASKHDLLVIEDACQAVGATYKNKKTGTLGDIGCFSLYATKNIMCGEGGIVTTDNEEYADAMKRFRQHGMSGPYEYAHIGFNYRMTDLHAAIAIEQLKKIRQFNERRYHNADLLHEGLKDITGISPPSTAPDRTHVFHQYTIRVTNNFPLTRDELAVALRQKEIGTGVYYPKPLHFYDHIAAIGYQKGDFPQAELAASQVLSIPVHPKLEIEEINYIIKVMNTI
ncbi:aminotransferase DegT [Candidatus Saccharibacteria bacterium CG_4_10_14_0_2_um_filter_52_9]|nr:MAG: aminotransferase DegT [Candidatus Saccharibacteria bacterium CG_4_10_14_0_2_um_filter_52_9]